MQHDLTFRHQEVGYWPGNMRCLSRSRLIPFVLIVMVMMAVESRAQDQIRTGQWQLELSGGANVPIGRFDERTFLAFQGARTGVHAGFGMFRKFSLSMTLGLGLNYFRFGSDLVGGYPPSRSSGQEHSAAGEIITLEPTWRWYIFSSQTGRNRPFIAFAPMITWGNFTVSHLYVPQWLPPGVREINANVDRQLTLGTMVAIGMDIPISASWKATVQLSHRHAPKTEARGAFGFGYDYESRAYFNTTWVDFTAAIKLVL